MSKVETNIDMKTNKKHFETFKKECEYWIKRFQLNGWKVEYVHAKLEDEVLGTLESNLDGYVALITFTTNIFDNGSDTTLEENIRETAKHEVIHLLLSRLSLMGKTRFTESKGYISAEEELVRKLEKIID